MMEYDDMRSAIMLMIVQQVVSDAVAGQTVNVGDMEKLGARAGKAAYYAAKSAVAEIKRLEHGVNHEKSK